jgi:hypothetical protein
MAVARKDSGRAVDTTKRHWGRSRWSWLSTEAVREPWPKPWLLMQA